MKHLLMSALMLLLAACAPAHEFVNGDSMLENAATSRSGEYFLGAGDKLRITVFDEPDLSGEFSVDGSGNLSLPLIGKVEAKDHTIQQVEQTIEEQLRGRYLVKPQVSAEVLLYRSFYILGEVEKPGEYPFRNGLTALNAVAIAGGFSPRADKDVMFIKRDSETEAKPYRLQEGLPVKPGDTLRINARYF